MISYSADNGKVVVEFPIFNHHQCTILFGFDWILKELH
jgi:hypothetical protein